MTKTVVELKAAIAELTAEMEAARKLDQSLASDTLATISKTYVWGTEWQTEFRFRAWCRLDEATLAAHAAWKIRFPEANGWSDTDRTQSMEYYLIGNYLLSSGGGSVVMKSWPVEKDAAQWASTFDQDPRVLTDDEVKSLRGGDVPLTLRYWDQPKIR